MLDGSSSRRPPRSNAPLLEKRRSNVLPQTGRSLAAAVGREYALAIAADAAGSTRPELDGHRAKIRAGKLPLIGDVTYCVSSAKALLAGTTIKRPGFIDEH